MTLSPETEEGLRRAAAAAGIRERKRREGQKPRPDCVFCDETNIAGLIEHHWSWTDPPELVRVFTPLNPVTPGHLLVVPAAHVEHAAQDARISAATMDVAAIVARRYESANLITSIGAPATQTVKHLHLHVVPRVVGDGLPLPWTPQHAARQADAECDVHRGQPKACYLCL